MRANKLRLALEELLGAVTAKVAPDTTQPIMWSGSPAQNRRMFAALEQAREALRQPTQQAAQPNAEQGEKL